MKVLIPSFTGLRLVERGREKTARLISLNPFFYRSSVGRVTSINRMRAWRLNPFFYRSSVGPDIIRKEIGLSLNPFFYRSSVGPKDDKETCSMVSLNPFFYRSSVGRLKWAAGQLLWS